MYGMYGKNGSGVSPENTGHIGHTVHQRAECPVAPTGHFARFRESRGNGWHTDFGTKYSVLYPLRYTHYVIPITAGDGNERGLAVASRVCDRAENEVKAGVGIDTRRSARFQKP